jgi:hypothetical protein
MTIRADNAGVSAALTIDAPTIDALTIVALHRL